MYLFSSFIVGIFHVSLSPFASVTLCFLTVYKNLDKFRAIRVPIEVPQWPSCIAPKFSKFISEVQLKHFQVFVLFWSLYPKLSICLCLFICLHICLWLLCPCHCLWFYLCHWLGFCLSCPSHSKLFVFASYSAYIIIYICLCHWPCISASVSAYVTLCIYLPTNTINVQSHKNKYKKRCMHSVVL